MTDETYTKQLDDLKCQLASLVEHVALGNLSPNAICEELNGMKSDLELIIDDFVDFDLDGLLRLGADSNG